MQMVKLSGGGLPHQKAVVLSGQVPSETTHNMDWLLKSLMTALNIVLESTTREVSTVSSQSISGKYG